MSRPRPVMVAARIVGGVVAIANAIPPLLIEFNVIDWTVAQLGQYVIFLNVVVGAASLMLGTRVESRVTPVADPRDNAGNVLIAVSPGPEPI